MSACPGCGRPFHKGKRCHVLLSSGELVSRVCCRKCAVSRSVRVVPIAAPVAVCSNAMAHDAAGNVLRPWAAHLRRMAEAYKATRNPLCLGLPMAAEMLDAGRAVPLSTLPDEHLVPGHVPRALTSEEIAELDGDRTQGGDHGG